MGVALAALAGMAHAQQTPEQPVPEFDPGPAVEETAPDPTDPAEPAEPLAPPDPGPAEPVTPEPAEPPDDPAVAPEPRDIDRGVRTISPGDTGVGVHGEGDFEPFRRRAMEFRDVPEGGETLTLMTPDSAQPVPDLLDVLSQAVDWNIVITPDVENETVRYWVEDVTAHELMEVLRFNGIYYDFDEESRYLYVMTQEEYLNREYGGVVQTDFTIEHANIDDMESLLSNFLSASGRMMTDPRTGYIMVMDTQDNIDAMRDLVNRLDVPLDPVTYRLHHVNADDAMESIEGLMSDRGMAYIDPRANTVTVTDLPRRQERIESLIESIDTPQETRTWILNYADVIDIADRIRDLVPEAMGLVDIDETIHQISVTAIPERLDEVGELIEAWDQPRRQVQITAYLVSVSSQVTRNLGINWHYFGTRGDDPYALQVGGRTPDFGATPDGQRFTIGELPYQIPLLQPLTNRPVTDIEGEVIPDPEWQGNRLSIVLDYLERLGEATILSRPQVTVTDGEEAIFESIEQRPFQEGGVVGGFDDDVGTGGRVIPLRVQFIDVGTVLRVMPRISEDGNIQLEVQAEDSTAETETITTGDRSTTVPRRRQDLAQTQVSIQDNHTLVIGGLRSSAFDDSTDAVPVLADLPFVGRLFQTTERGHDARDLMVFITPTIVDEYTQPEADRLAQLDEELAGRARDMRRTAVERLLNRITRGDNEISVSVGQTGSLHSSGERVDIEDLAATFDGVESPARVTVVVRAHPRAPYADVDSVVRLAADRGMSVEMEENASPFVPISYEEAGEEREPLPTAP